VTLASGPLREQVLAGFRSNRPKNPAPQAIGKWTDSGEISRGGRPLEGAVGEAHASGFRSTGLGIGGLCSGPRRSFELTQGRPVFPVGRRIVRPRACDRDFGWLGPRFRPIRPAQQFRPVFFIRKNGHPLVTAPLGGKNVGQNRPQEMGVSDQRQRLCVTERAAYSSTSARSRFFVCRRVFESFNGHCARASFHRKRRNHQHFS